MKKSDLYIFLVYFLCAQNVSHSWKVNTYKDEKLPILEMKFKNFLDQRPEFKISEVHEWYPQFKKWYNTKSSFCSLKTTPKKFACATVLINEEMEKLVIDREYLKSDRCLKVEVKFLRIENDDNPEKSQAVGGFQCPPTRLVNEPFFLTDGEDLGKEKGGPTLYLLHRKDGEKTVNVVAQITEIDEEQLKNMQEILENIDEDIPL